MGIMKIVEKTRFSIVLLFLWINLAAFALLRVALLIKQLSDIDSPVYLIVLAFFLGIINDLAFFSYLLIPFALYLQFLPNSIYQTSQSGIQTCQLNCYNCYHPSQIKRVLALGLLFTHVLLFTKMASGKEFHSCIF